MDLDNPPFRPCVACRIHPRYADRLCVSCWHHHGGGVTDEELEAIDPLCAAWARADDLAYEGWMLFAREVDGDAGRLDPARLADDVAAVLVERMARRNVAADLLNRLASLGYCLSLSRGRLVSYPDLPPDEASRVKEYEVELGGLLDELCRAVPSLQGKEDEPPEGAVPRLFARPRHTSLVPVNE